MPLLLTLPYCNKDAALLKKCLEWMAELQPHYAPHSCLLVADAAVPHDLKLELNTLARGMFRFAETINVTVPEAQQGWPLGPTLMFASAARQIEEVYCIPWLWFEPDAVPLRIGWLDHLAEEYELTPKRFMGSHIPSNGQEDMPPIHLSGCSIYDVYAYSSLQPLLNTKKPFDLAIAGYTVPRSVNTPLMQHYWGTHELAPTFKSEVGPLDAKNVLPLNFLKSDAVMFHRCKDGSLIDLLRQKLNSESGKTVPARRPRKATT